MLKYNPGIILSLFIGLRKWQNSFRELFQCGAILFIIYLLHAQSILAQNRIQSEIINASGGFGFIENKGQIYDQDYNLNSAVKYILTMNNGMNVQLKANSFSYDTYSIERNKREKKNEETELTLYPIDSIDDYDITYHFHRVDIELVDANPNPVIVAEGPSEDYLNYYNSVTPEEGVNFVHHFQKVIYRNLYPGIDLEFVSNDEKAFEYNFIIHPGADASQIRIKYEGAYETKLSDGKVFISVAQGSFYEYIPACYLKESKNGVGAQFVILGENEIGIRVKPYNDRETLIIDPYPIRLWGTYYGGTNSESGQAIRTDLNGNIYFTGATSSFNAIATSGAYQTSLSGGNDAYVVKLNSAGQRIWGTYFGGTANENSYDIAIDKYNNVVISGETYSSSGISTSGTHQQTLGGSNDAFIAKFNASGQRIWSTYYGGTATDVGYAVSNDTSGNLYLSGIAYSNSGIATTGAYSTSLSGANDAFIVKFNENGQRLWGTYYGGSSIESVYDIAIDASGNVICGGMTGSGSSIATFGAFQSVYGGGTYDGMVIKFNASGQRIWATYYGGADGDAVRGIALDEAGFISLTGSTSSTSGISTSGTFQNFPGGLLDGFVAKLSPNGQRLWGTYYGGTGNDYGEAILSDKYNNIIICGYTTSLTGISTTGAHQVAFGGGYDAFVAKFDLNGQRIWGTYYGGSGSDDGVNISLTDNWNILLTGITSSATSISTSGTHQTTRSGTNDAYVVKFAGCMPVIDSLSYIICDSFYFGGIYHKVSGEYTDTLLSYYGCDSIVFLTIYIPPKPVVNFTISDTIRCFKGNHFVFTNQSTVDTGTIAGYFWDFGDGETDTTASPVHIFKSSGTFTVTLTVYSNFNCIGRAAKNIIVLPSPVSKFNIYDSFQCLESNAFAFINKSSINSGSVSYTWNFGDSITSTLENPVHTYIYSGIFNITLIALSDLGCSDTSAGRTYVVAYPEPVADFNISDTAMCQRNNFFAFSNKGSIKSGSFTSFWEFGDGDTMHQPNAQHFYNNDGIFKVKLILVSDFGCKDSIMKSVYVWPMPMAAFTVDKTAQCFQSNLFEFKDISSVKSGTLSRQWFLGDADSSSTPLVAHHYLNYDTFRVKLISTSEFNCRDTAESEVVVHPMPKAGFSINDNTQCVRGNLFVFSDSSQLAYGNLSYYWSFGDGTHSSLQSPSHTYSTYDSVEVKLLVKTAHGCEDSSSAVIVTYPMPHSDFSIKKNGQCLSGNFFEFTNKSNLPYGSISYLWDFGDGANSSSINPNHQYSRSDTFVVSLTTISNYGCRDTLVRHAVVFPMPAAAFDIPENIQCFSNNLFNFNNNSSIASGNLNYRWFFGDGDSSQSINSCHSYRKADSFIVRLFAISPFSCIDSVSKKVRVLPSPKAAFSVNDSSQCYNEQKFQFNDLSTVNGSIITQLLWIFGTDTIRNAKSVLYSDFPQGVQKAMLVAFTADGCMDSFVRNITVLAIPKIQFSILDTGQCVDSNLFEFINSTTISEGYCYYMWYFGDGSTSPDPSPKHHYENDSTYRIKMLASSNNNCKDSLIKQVVVFPRPVVDFYLSKPCLLKQTLFYSSGSIKPGYSITSCHWDFGDTSVSNLCNTSHVFSVSKTYNIKLTLTSNKGCVASSSKKIYVSNESVGANKIIRASVSEDQSVLVEWTPPVSGSISDFLLERSVNESDYSLLLMLPPGVYSYNDKNVNTSHESYYYRIRCRDSCDRLSPYSNIGRTILLKADKSGDYPQLNWNAYEQWDEGVSGYDIMVYDEDWKNYRHIAHQNETSFSDYISALNQEKWCYRITAQRAGDKLESHSNISCIDADFNYFLPNSFTPNSDGLNDYFRGAGTFIAEYNLKVFDRWGTVVFESTDPAKGWDGTYRDEACPAGIYQYYLYVMGSDGTRIRREGKVVLLR